MDTLYTLFRSVDNSHTPPLTLAEAAEGLARKKAFFAEEARTNPLAREIFRAGTIKCISLPAENAGDFLSGPPTFFRLYELLRKTRSKNLPLYIGESEFSHNDVVAMYARCVPNVKLEHAPWCSLARYRTSLGLAWGSSLLVAHLVGRNSDTSEMLDPAVLYHMGLYTTLLALLYTTFQQNRDVRHAAPWNTAMYLDLNTDLIRRDLPAATAARKEIMPRQKLFKTPEFYHAVAKKIESHGFDAELARSLAATPTAAPASPAGRR